MDRTCLSYALQCSSMLADVLGARVSSASGRLSGRGGDCEG